MKNELQVDATDVVNLWLQCQGLGQLSKRTKLTKTSFGKHLETTGAVQLDSVNVVDRAHYLTLWSRFGKYDKSRLDKLIYDDKIAFEYWGHEASLLPQSHFRLSQQRMKRFPHKQWKQSAWWTRYQTSASSKRRVMSRLAKTGPLESTDFEKHDRERANSEIGGWGSTIAKEDKRSLQLLWHAGRVGISNRRHFRKVYDLADRVFSDHVFANSEPASTVEYEDSWLLKGLVGNGIASEAHLKNYFTAPALTAKKRAKVIARNLRQKTIVPLRVKGFTKPFFALPEHLDALGKAAKPTGTALICPFDSLLWQRQRAEDLLGFRYRVEIYVPSHKREFGYYVLPILHEGKLVGRLDPKFDRQNNRLLIHAIFLESWFKRSKSFEKSLKSQLVSLADFLGAAELQLPEGWNI